MKKSIGYRLMQVFLSLVVCAALYSFSWGGDHFEVYLDKKLVFRQFLHVSKEAGVFSLDKANPESTVEVFYGHCGQPGKSRSLVIKDAQDNIVNRLSFADASAGNKFMTCKVKDITGIQKKYSGKLFIYYTSKELPAGTHLATVSSVEKNIAAR